MRRAARGSHGGADGEHLMDLTTVTDYRPAPGARWQPGDAWLGGGTWLFSEPQPGLRRLLDLQGYYWPPLTETCDGVEIAATCTIAELTRWRPARRWGAAALPGQCCDALLASFKVQHVATVGGNICLGLPAGAMTSLVTALDGRATIWSPGGAARQVPVTEFVTGPGQTGLRPGELLRSVLLPAAALGSRTAFRRASLARLGRSAVLVIGRRPAAGAAPVVVTITAATPRPVQLRFPGLPSPDDAVAALDRMSPAYHDDLHGAPAWRAALTRRYVAEVVAELAG